MKRRTQEEKGAGRDCGGREGCMKRMTQEEKGA
jgi:hypothetical protein